ncbi:hypothetical protein ZIOFF_000035 [Zingiber officinale]|uniref:Gnk2-homologous domain-containing protein n=1 Tax=Zingiber officinale TaxID=94328 RepID=A0A8J5LXM6_ZINOF|nr:hypothetical protein ZIOFF_000035 [Zingiber officinale]
MSPSTNFRHSLLLLLFSSTSLIAAQPLYNICGTTGNFTANSTYQTNLNRLLSTLSLNASTSGFTTSTVGQVPNLVIGLALCRGDVNTTECRGAAILWYDFCFLRFSNQQFLGSTSNDPSILLGNTANVSSPQRFSRLLNFLLNSTLNNATGSDTRFATGEAWEKWSGGAALEIVDPVLGLEYRGSDVLRCLQIGLLCVQENPSDRPSMITVGLMLSSETVSVQTPSKPAFCGAKSFKDVSVSDSSALPVGALEKERHSIRGHVAQRGVHFRTGT